MRSFLLSFIALSLGASVLAQAPSDAQSPRTPRPAPAAETPKAQPNAARREGQPVNIKVEIAIADQHGPGQPLKKSVTVISGDTMNGFIRSTANYSNVGNIPLNVDVGPEILPDGKIRLHLNLEYDLPAPAAVGQSDVPVTERALRVMQIRENLALILENGKPIIAAQSADPVSDRQVTIEVKATILR